MLCGEIKGGVYRRRNSQWDRLRSCKIKQAPPDFLSVTGYTNPAPVRKRQSSCSGQAVLEHHKAEKLKEEELKRGAYQLSEAADCRVEKRGKVGSDPWRQQYSTLVVQNVAVYSGPWIGT
ncbi:unnamed protein product [Caretta caretta]